MGRQAILYGLFLIALGVGAYILTDGRSVTALIPTVFGAALCVCGRVAKKEALRMHAMHAAALLAVLGIFGSFSGVLKLGQVLNGTAEHPIAILSRATMAVVLIVFLVLCVRSFIAARKSRQRV